MLPVKLLFPVFGIELVINIEKLRGPNSQL